MLDSDINEHKEYPGPIWNLKLLENEAFLIEKNAENGYSNYPVKENVKINDDFIIIPCELWQKLKEIYGGIEISRLMKLKDDNKKYEVDIYLQKINILIRPYDSWMPCNGTGILYIGKHELNRTLFSKIISILSQIFHTKAELSVFAEKYKFRFFKILPEFGSVENLDKLLSKLARINFSQQLEIDAQILNPDQKINENFNISENSILLEIVPINAKFIFKEPVIIKPRYYEGDQKSSEEELKKYLRIKNLEFAKIPINAIVPSSCKKGKIGIENIGNTCYMNSGLQCLSHIPELTKYFLLKLYENEINTVNPLGQKGEFAKTYAETIEDLWLTKNSKPINALALKKKIVQKAGQFKGNAQQDSQELILHILDALHEDLNRIKKKPYISEPEYDGRPDNILSAEQWELYLQRNRSIIVDLFAGQFKSCIQCPFCKEFSIKFEPFMALSVPIPLVVAAKIIFVHWDLFKGNIQIELTISESTTLEEITLQIKNIINLPSECGIAYFTGQNTNTLKNISKDAYFPNLATLKEPIFAFEYHINPEIFGIQNEILQNEIQFMQILLKYKAKSLFSTNIKQPEIPIIVPIHKNSSLKQLRIAIFNRIRILLNIPLKKQRLTIDKQYEKLFFSQSKPSPYQIEIMNNRAQKSKYYFMSEYAPCEFCSGNPHSGDCLLDFKCEDKVRVIDVLKLIKDGRELKLSILVSEGNDFVNNSRTMAFLAKSTTLTKIQATTSRFKISLYNCLELFSKEEQLDLDNMWYCPKCKQNVQAIKKISIYKLPRILIIQLKRFRQKVSPLWVSQGKSTDFVEYPTNGLNMSQFVISNSDGYDQNQIYDLFAVSSHYGELSGGHYVASCYNPAYEKWFRFNDDNVEKAQEDDIVSSLAYVLFYHRID